MKVYFACSIRGGRELADSYAIIAEHIASQAELLTEVFADKKLSPKGMNKPSATIWKTDTDWIKECDIIVAEVTNPSLGVGYEIAYAENLNKPILALFNKDSGYSLSAMIEGSPKTNLIKYSNLQVAKIKITQFIKTHEK